ncbi:MAG: hypothetical protein P4M00_19825 [Azospirillaceae bacterium]|nr:hypothetical protein [Azospirillaceae bacterium]
MAIVPRIEATRILVFGGIPLFLIAIATMGLQAGRYDSGHTVVVRLGETFLPTDGGDQSLSPLQRGWCQPESWGVWSCDKETALAFRLPPLARDLRLRINMVPAPTTIQPLEIFVNGYRLARFAVADDRAYEVGIPKDIADSALPMSVEFSIPNAIVPAKAGLSADTRKIGIGLRSITLSMKP